jgi:hypothetical protein
MNLDTGIRMQIGLEFIDMINEGMEPVDCLLYAVAEGIEYPDAVWLVTRTLRLTDEAVEEMEEGYKRYF